MAVTVVGFRSPFLSLANPGNTDSFLGPSQKFASIFNSPSKPKSNPKNAYPQLLHFIFHLDSPLSISRYSAQRKSCSIHPYLPATAQIIIIFQTFCGRASLPVDVCIFVTFFRPGVEAPEENGKQVYSLFDVHDAPRPCPSFPVTFRRNQLWPNTAEHDVERLNDGCVFQTRLIGS